MAERTYMILEGEVSDAHSTLSAVTAYAAGIEASRTLKLVAVPMRSWKPVLLERRPEWTTRLTAEPEDVAELEPIDEE